MGAPGYYLVSLDSDGEPNYDGSGLPVVSGSLVPLPMQARIGVKYDRRPNAAASETIRSGMLNSRK